MICNGVANKLKEDQSISKFKLSTQTKYPSLVKQVKAMPTRLTLSNESNSAQDLWAGSVARTTRAFCQN